MNPSAADVTTLLNRLADGDLIAWSQNMTPEATKAVGATLVSKEQLLEMADILTIHLVLSCRTRDLVEAALERMKPTAWLIQASRGPIAEEQALSSVLKNQQIAGPVINVFDIDPLPPSHPFRRLANVLTTPHIGYVAHGLYKTFYEDASRILGSGSTPIKDNGEEECPKSLKTKSLSSLVAIWDRVGHGEALRQGGRL